uniref:Uncharacterized protein n=1 Tax=Setaria italica TaxID=4555 RepID=K3ZZ45_SETIT
MLNSICTEFVCLTSIEFFSSAQVHNYIVSLWLVSFQIKIIHVYVSKHVLLN